jgi:hypothetical protein
MTSSMRWAAHPVTRDMAKMGVKSCRGMPIMS